MAAVGWLERMFRGGASNDAVRESQPRAASFPIRCPNRACQSEEFAVIAPTHTARRDGLRVTLEPFGYRVACLKCGCIYAANPNECYEVMEARPAAEAIATNGAPQSAYQPRRPVNLREVG